MSVANEPMLKALMKYGVGGVIAIYLTFTMATNMDKKLDKLVELQADSYRALFNIERLLRNDGRQASTNYELRQP